MENQKEKNMENEMETGGIQGFKGSRNRVGISEEASNSLTQMRHLSPISLYGPYLSLYCPELPKVLQKGTRKFGIEPEDEDCDN